MSSFFGFGENTKNKFLASLSLCFAEARWSVDIVIDVCLYVWMSYSLCLVHATKSSWLESIKESANLLRKHFWFQFQGLNPTTSPNMLIWRFVYIIIIQIFCLYFVWTMRAESCNWFFDIVLTMLTNIFMLCCYTDSPKFIAVYTSYRWRSYSQLFVLKYSALDISAQVIEI